MATYGVAEAKNKFTHLLARVEAGESVTITRHGKAIAQMNATSQNPPKPSLEDRRMAMARLTAVVESQPPIDISAVDLIRQMRDEGY